MLPWGIFILKKLNLILALVLTLGVILYVLVRLDWEDVGHTFLSLNGYVLVAAFCVYLINYFFRMIRFKVLLNLEDIPILPLLGVTHLYGMYLYLMPAKFGEVTFPILLKRRLNVDIRTSTGTLIVARLFDFFSIALILLLVLILYWGLVPMNMQLVSVGFCIFVLILFSLFIWMIRNPSRITEYLEKRNKSGTIVHKIRDFLMGVYHGTRIVEEQKKYLTLLALSLVIWLCVNGNFFLITVSLGYTFNFFQIIVVSIIMIPVTLFPLQGFANIGAHEVGWVTAFTLFNFPYDAALNIAISSHIIHVLFVLLLGLLGIVMVSIQRSISGSA